MSAPFGLRAKGEGKVEGNTECFRFHPDQFDCLLANIASILECHQKTLTVKRPVYTGDFCRIIQCNFCRAEVATS